MPPTPGASVVPRANTTWTSGHGSADAEGTGAISSTQAGAIAVQTKLQSWCFTARFCHNSITVARFAPSTIGAPRSAYRVPVGSEAPMHGVGAVNGAVRRRWREADSAACRSPGVTIWIELLWYIRTRKSMLPVVTVLPAHERTGGTQHAAECVSGSHHRQHDQQDEHKQPIRPGVADVPPDDGERQHTEEEHNVPPIALVRKCGHTQRAGLIGGIDQVIDAGIDAALQVGASSCGFRREPIQQVHVLLELLAIVWALESPGRNAQHCATNNGCTAQRDLSQTIAPLLVRLIVNVGPLRIAEPGQQINHPMVVVGG